MLSNHFLAGLLRSQLPRYAISALTLGAALWLTQLLSLWAVAAEISLLLCFIAVIFSAWYGGVRLGFLITGAAMLLCGYLFLEPMRSLDGRANEWVVLSLFGVGGVLISLLCGKLQSASQNLEGQEQTAQQQLQRYQQVQQFNEQLEREVQRRIAQLQLVSDFEMALKRITDKVRDSLDEAQILQAAVQELGLGMGVNSCNASLYDLKAGTATIAYEYNPSILSFKGHTTPMAEYPELYAQLLAGQSFQFCPLHTSPMRGRVAILACPIYVDQEVLGDLWLLTDRDYGFKDLDLRLAQQVANQCAIAVRQARLYRTAQTQVTELETLNQLKDDFLSTVSHELRTPVSNMKLSICMLELALKQMPFGFTPTSKPVQYLKILRDECEREIQLINDLLDLQRLEAGTHPGAREVLHLYSWLAQLVDRFQERSQSRQQELQLRLPSDLPLLWVDLTSLERILTELLNNACKYTPPGQQITVSASLEQDAVQLKVCNTGIEIPPDKLPRIFEKFYRIVDSDRWKQGGTGLGLTLVQRLVDHMGADITVESHATHTTFTLLLPNAVLAPDTDSAGNAVDHPLLIVT